MIAIMNILFLGPPNEKMSTILRKHGHQILGIESPLDVQFLKENHIDFAISYGYRHIIKSNVLSHLKKHIINLHISYLPWNRGADPNLWSFLENTPKGVTIHLIDEGIDTGDIIAQKKIDFLENENTLATTYIRLQKEILLLFEEQTPFIIKGCFEASKQPHGGTFHKSADKNKFIHLLSNGWNTPVELLIGKALI